MSTTRRMGRWGLGLLCGWLIAVHAHAAPMHCLVNSPTTCPNTNFLSWAPGFDKAVARFTRGLESIYFGAKSALKDEALLGLGGPPQERVELPGHRYLFSACPPHDCAGNAVAVILDAHGNVQALGFSSFHCGLGCDIHHRYLDFYIRQGLDQDPLIEALWEWGTGDTSHPNFPEANIGLKTRLHIYPVP